MISRLFERRDRIVVKTYEDRKPKKAAEKYQRDAKSMAKKGYDVVNVVSNDEKAGMLLLGGLGLLGKTTLTVTYQLRDA